MKRLICTLIVIVCFTCSAAYAGGHIGIEGTFSGQNSGEIITADLYQQEGDTVLVSSLFPDLAVILNHGCTADDMLYELLRFKPGQIVPAMDMTDRILAEWLQRLNMKSYSGSYSGEAFEYASSMSMASFQLSDFARFLDDVFSKESQKRFNDLVLTGDVDGAILMLQYYRKSKAAQIRRAELERQKRAGDTSFRDVYLFRMNEA